ncbi:hypothetical protein E3U43_007682 [Larimichthys crocea]|uniref:Uncharacterized protein n=1 Tax=Larimichthys crocea TaxID=215358 RepID=A0ACD3Q4V2_LARCR|nr:hypothetical protein E3U43_007682 [Larimichthys crocea]
MSNTWLVRRINDRPQPPTPILACSKILLCVMPIAEIAIGAVYLDDCPRQRYIPIYLIVMGVFSLVLALLSCLPCAQEPKDGSTNPLSRICATWNSLITCFLFCWFIADGTEISDRFGNLFAKFDSSVLIMLEANGSHRICKVLPVIIVFFIVNFCIMLLAHLGVGITIYIPDSLNRPVILICMMVVLGGTLLLYVDICNCVINFILFFILTIVCNALSFAIYVPMFCKYAGEEYCNQTLRQFAFGITIFTYFVLVTVFWGLCYEKLPEDDTEYSVDV